MRGLLTDLSRSIPLGRLRLGLAVLLAVAASASSVALMGVSAWLISFAALLPPVLYLQAPAVGVRTFAISRGVFRYVERLIGHDVALRMQSVLRMRTYDSLARTTLIGAHRGDLLTRAVSDTEAVTDVVVRVLIPIASGLLVITGTSVGIAFVSPWAGVALLATTLLAGVVVPLLAQRATFTADRDAAPTRGELADTVREVARTAPDLVAYGAEHACLARLLEVDDRLRHQEARSAWVQGVAASAQVLAAGCAVVAGLAIPPAPPGPCPPRSWPFWRWCRWPCTRCWRRSWRPPRRGPAPVPPWPASGRFSTPTRSASATSSRTGRPTPDWNSTAWPSAGPAPPCSEATSTWWCDPGTGWPAPAPPASARPPWR